MSFYSKNYVEWCTRLPNFTYKSRKLLFFASDYYIVLTKIELSAGFLLSTVTFKSSNPMPTTTELTFLKLLASNKLTFSSKLDAIKLIPFLTFGLKIPWSLNCLILNLKDT